MRITRYSILALCESFCVKHKSARRDCCNKRGAVGDSVIVILFISRHRSTSAGMRATTIRVVVVFFRTPVIVSIFPSFTTAIPSEGIETLRYFRRTKHGI